MKRLKSLLLRGMTNIDSLHRKDVTLDRLAACFGYRECERSEDAEQAEQVECDRKQGVAAVCRRPPRGGGVLLSAAGFNMRCIGIRVGRRQGLRAA